MKKYHHNKGACPLDYNTLLYLDIWDFGEGSHVEAILEGTYVYPNNNSPAVKTLLRHLQRPATEPSTLMSLAAYRES